MAAPRMKVRVAIPDLIEKIKAAKAKRLADYERDLAKFQAEDGEYPAKVATALEKAHQAALNGKLPAVDERYVRGSYRNALQVVVSFQQPSKPSKPSVDSYDRDVALLEMSSDDVIAIGVDDHFARYL